MTNFHATKFWTIIEITAKSWISQWTKDGHASFRLVRLVYERTPSVQVHTAHGVHIHNHIASLPKA